MDGFRLTSYLSIFISIYCLLHISSVVKAECDKCEALPAAECQQGRATPFSGGPPCTCAETRQPQGCILKPCELVNDDSICDCTRSTGSVKNRNFCHKYRCSGQSGECQFCKNLPPDCTMNSYINPPASGGPECSCAYQATPGGCTMKPCMKGALQMEPCVSKPGGVSQVILYGATCPGSFETKGGASGVGMVKSTGYLLGLVVLIYFAFLQNDLIQ